MKKGIMKSIHPITNIILIFKNRHRGTEIDTRVINQFGKALEFAA